MVSRKVPPVKISPARLVSFETLMRVAVEKSYTNVALQNALRKSSLSERDKALVTEIVYGTVRRQITLDALIQPYVNRSLPQVDAYVLTILRMSVYQLSYLTKVPAYAVINEAVDLAKRFAPKASSFVNGVLRSFTRAKSDIEDRVDAAVQASHGGSAAKLSLRYGYPKWLVERLTVAYGTVRAERVLEMGNRAAPTTVRVNRLKSSVEDVIASLRESGIEAVERGCLSPDALRVHEAIDVESLPAYQRGEITLQDEGAMLIAPLLRAKSGMRVLDMCAAPGGKTTHIAELMADEGIVDAFDVYLQKVRMLQDISRRLDLTCIHPRLGDGRDLDVNGEHYDAVLVDAPCSGLGVMRRRPDIRHRRKPEDIKALSVLQQGLLERACLVTKPGGIIVYATCTLLPQENEAVVDAVLSKFRGMLELDDISDDLPNGIRQTGLGVTLTPEQHNTDGFYMVRLMKK